MSDVQICNRGLSTYLGVARINSLTESTPAAEQCSIHYSDTLQSLTEAHWWHFASGRQVLAELVNDRPDEWSYRYQMPATALMVRWVNDPSIAAAAISVDQDPDCKREISGDSIYCNVALASCEFTKLITDTSRFPQYFSDALSAAIAANVAMPLTEDMRRAQNAMQQAEAKLDKAIALDEEQTGVFSYQTTASWMAARGIS